MGKNQSASNLTNVIQISSTGNVTFVSGSTTLMSISSSGAITTTGVISGSNALSASYAANADTLDGLNSTAFATTGAYSDTSGSLYTVSSSAYATSGSLSTASGSLSATSGSLSAASGSFNTRVSALEVTGSALSSSILSVSSSAYATSGSLSTASGSFDSRVATIESKYATTGSNTFISTQVISGSILQSGSFTTTGTIIAQTINVQSVTSSVVYSSGSNVFGNDIGNSQTFTGSVLITGSLTIAGASSATSYSGTTIFGSTIACSPIGCFATSCATSFIGGTMSGTTIYGSTAVCSANGLLIGNGGVTATCNYLPKFTGASAIGNSIVSESSGIVSVAGRFSASGNDFHSVIVDQGTAQLKLERITTSAGYMYIGADNVGFKIFDSAFATRLTLTSGGNLGLGVTPSAWVSGYNVFQFGVSSTQTSALFSNGVNNFWSVSNTYFDGTNFKRVATGTATGYEQVNGAHKWYQVASDSAGTNITFTQAMTLTASGRLLIGTPTEATYQLDVNGTGRFNGGVTVKSGNGDQLQLNNAGERFTQINFSNNTVSKANIWWDNTNTELVLLAAGSGTGHLKIASTGAATFTNTETTFNYNPQSGSLLASYNYLNFGGGSIMYRNATDIYIGSNAKYGSAGTVVAGYTSLYGMGLLTMDAGTLNYQANNTSVTAGTAYGVPIRFTIKGDGNIGIGASSPCGKLQVVLPAYTNEDTDSQQAIFGSCTNGYGVRIGYNESCNAGYINSLKPGVAWSNLSLQGSSIVFAPTATERVRVTTDGLTFNGDTAAANALDDYEEGTWTPVIGGSGGQSGQSYSGQNGYYIKIGRQVTVTFRVVLSNKGTITGEAGIKNLPFTADGTISYGSGATYFEGLATSWNSIFFMVNGSTTFASFDGTKSAGTATTRATTSDIGNSTQFNGSFTYLTA